MKNNASIEKRDHSRTSVPDYFVEFEQVSGNDYGDIQNVSCHGMKIKSIAKMILGSVSLTFKLHGFNKRKTVPGEVVWVDEDNYSYGIKFWHSLSPCNL